MEFLNEVNDYLEVSDVGTKAFFLDKRYEVCEIRSQEFHEVNSVPEKCVFIDGGNAELVSAPNFSLNLIRLAAVAYNGKEKLFSKRLEFYCIVSSNIEDKMYYEAKILGENKKIIKFDSNDSTIRDGIHKASISKIANVVRRFAELEFASEFSGIVILDGILQKSFSGEEEYLNKLFATGNKIVGFAKSNTLVTDKSWPVSQVLARNTNLKDWWYKIASSAHQDHEADIYFAKLNEKADRPFRIEVFNGSEYDFSEICNALAANSVDIAFPGYPYGLIEADRLARISHTETAIMKTRARTLMGKSWKQLDEFEKNINAHDVLDSM